MIAVLYGSMVAVSYPVAAITVLAIGIVGFVLVRSGRSIADGRGIRVPGTRTRLLVSLWIGRDTPEPEEYYTCTIAIVRER